MRFYEALIQAGNSLQSLLLLLMRLYWGFMFFQTGLGKFMNHDQVAQYFQSLNVPFSEATVYLVAAFEFVGGLMLFFGLGSRLIALPLIAILCTAYATAHREALVHIFQNTEAFIQQPPFTYLFTCLVVFCFGPGKYSVDRMIEIERG